MDVLISEVERLGLMAILVVFSGFFSGAETALFSLTDDSADSLKKRHPRLGSLITSLLGEPEQVLSSILFGNLLINTMYFSLGARLAVLAQKNTGNTGMAITSIGVLAFLILFGEILPKALAAGSPESSSMIASAPMWVFNRVVGRPALFFARPALALVNVFSKRVSKKDVEAGELRMLIDMAERSGAVKETEAELIDAVVVFSQMRVREVMTPRVDVDFVDINSSSREALKILASSNHERAPVFSESHENVVGVILSDDLIDSPEKTIESLMQPVKFVPENAILAQTSQSMSDADDGIVMVVDEYGGMAGLLSNGDIAEALLRGFTSRGVCCGDELSAVVQLEQNHYSLAGELRVRNWAELWGQDATEGVFDTLGGFITSLMGKIPQAGDEVRWRNIEFKATEVLRGRVKRVEMRLRPEVGE